MIKDDHEYNYKRDSAEKFAQSLTKISSIKASASHKSKISQLEIALGEILSGLCEQLTTYEQRSR